MTESFVNNIVVVLTVVTDVEHPAHGHVYHVLIHITVGIVVVQWPRIFVVRIATANINLVTSGSVDTRLK